MIVILISNASKKQIKSERFDQKSKITQMKIKIIKLFIILVFVNPISGKDWIISPNNNAQEEIQGLNALEILFSLSQETKSCFQKEFISQIMVFL